VVSRIRSVSGIRWRRACNELRSNGILSA
jgi:hypothetical protein